MANEIEKDKIDIRKLETDEFFDKSPDFLVVWGITLVSLSVMLFLIGSWFFKYPDITILPITITAENPPVIVVAKKSGKIASLQIKNNQKVAQGDLLAIIENATDYKEVLAVKKLLSDLTGSFYIIGNNALKLDEFHLGELQPAYSSFIKCCMDNTNFVKLDYYNKKLLAVKKQMEKIKLYADTKEEKSQNFLFEDIQLAQLEQTVLDVQFQYMEQKSKLELATKETLNFLNNQIASWEQNNLLRAPIIGKVVFATDLPNDQNVIAGDIIFTIVPDSIKQIIGKVNIPIQIIGIVSEGQAVNIKFDSYPFMEYGIVKGKVNSISMLPSNQSYSAEILLTNGLITNNNKTLKFNYEMQGIAEIITADLRLFDRIIKPIKSALKINL